MFQTLGNTLSLVGTSARVLREERLLFFPLASGVALLLVMLYVLMAFTYGGTFDRVGHGFRVLPADFIFAGLAYCSASFIVLYFSAALAAAAHYRIIGGSPDVRFGLEAANDRLGAIALWAVLAGTVGLVIKPIAERGGFIGRFGGFWAELLGGWAPFLVVPVMMVEGAPPLAAMRRSTELFKQAWGRRAVGNFGFGRLYLLLLVLAVLIAVGLPVTGASGGMAIALAMAFFALTTASLKCLESVFIVALYNYASLGETDGCFPEHVLRTAYVARGERHPFRSPPSSHHIPI